MTHADAFLEDILARPDDDAPRLVYADWLEEQGGPAGAARAEFIRIQCALAAGARRAALEAREQELLDAHAAVWLRPVRRLIHGWGFHRGFLDEVLVDAVAFLARADRLFARAPVQHLHLFWRSPGTPDGRARLLRGLLDCPHLGRLHSLNLSHGGLGSMAVEALAGSDRLGLLTSLNLARNRIGPAGVRALAGSPLLARLSSLDLSGNDLGPVGARALARALEEQAASPDGLRLRRVDLADNNLSRASRLAVTTSPLLQRVVRL